MTPEIWTQFNPCLLSKTLCITIRWPLIGLPTPRSLKNFKSNNSRNSNYPPRQVALYSLRHSLSRPQRSKLCRHFKGNCRWLISRVLMQGQIRNGIWSPNSIKSLTIRRNQQTSRNLRIVPSKFSKCPIPLLRGSGERKTWWSESWSQSRPSARKKMRSKSSGVERLSLIRKPVMGEKFLISRTQPCLPQSSTRVREEGPILSHLGIDPISSLIRLLTIAKQWLVSKRHQLMWLSPILNKRKRLKNKSLRLKRLIWIRLCKSL